MVVNKKRNVYDITAFWYLFLFCRWMKAEKFQQLFNRVKYHIVYTPVCSVINFISLPFLTMKVELSYDNIK